VDKGVNQSEPFVMHSIHYFYAQSFHNGAVVKKKLSTNYVDKFLIYLAVFMISYLHKIKGKN